MRENVGIDKYDSVRFLVYYNRTLSTSSHMNVSHLGQVFTPPDIVQTMLGLRQNKGPILEPAAGDGAFMGVLGDHAVGIEIDKSISSDQRVVVGDFFSYPVANKFQTVIGNPPYVRFQDIKKRTKQLLPMAWFDRRSNLYLFFIAKCMMHLENRGELIFITPRDFLKSTSARKLNRELYIKGAITDYLEMGDSRIFDGFSPNCAIWRWEKGRRSKKTNSGRNFCYKDGQIWFGNEDLPATSRLGDLFDVKVGAVSGADHIFSNARNANIQMVCSTTRVNGEPRRMIYNKKCKYLSKYKDELLGRRIKKFDDSNWWTWGRAYHKKEGPRIYVNCKTRNPKPFFISDTEAYDGSVMALFPRNGAARDIGRITEKLNSLPWDELGFACDGRLLFTQHSLQNAPIGDLL